MSTGRTVALVGRPNVGKSAMFNRIARERVAIVYEEAGVTRDRLEREITRDGQTFNLIDTGGILTLDGERLADGIGAAVRAQAQAAIGGAAVVVFVVDVMAGVNPLDEEVARILRKAGANVIIAANKSDNDGLRHGAADFDRFGFPVFPVSSLHGHGFGELLAEVYKRLPPAEPEKFGAGPDDAKERLSIAVVGRPNGGKSSFINKLLKEERLVVSDVPGTTRDTIDVPFDFGGRKWTLIDTAGVRREARVDTAVERYSRYRMQDAVERADLIVLMLDCERGAGLLDRQLAGMIEKSGKGCVIAVNKWDVKHPSEKEYFEKLANELPFMTHCPVVFLSAKSGYNVGKVLSTVADVAAESYRELPTGRLNRCLQEACKDTVMPGRNGKPLKVFYATQSGVNPIRVKLFVNEVRRMPPSFEKFLQGALRDEFGLSGAGIVLHLRERERVNPDGSVRKKKAPESIRTKRAERKSSGKARTRRRALPRG